MSLSQEDNYIVKSNPINNQSSNSIFGRRNNDLWSLLPADSKINRLKSDKMPTPHIIEKQKDLILEYLDIISESQKNRFEKELQISLLGNHDIRTYKETGIFQLQKN